MNIVRQLSWLVLLLAIASPALGRDKDHFAVKLGMLQHDNPAYDPAINLNLAIGGKLLRGDFVSLGLQLEMSTSVVEGETQTAREDWEMDSHALYSVLHVGKNHYLKLKAGYIDWQLRHDLGPERNGNGFSWGAAYGYPLDNGHTVELEYTRMTDEEDFEISLISLGYYF